MRQAERLGRCSKCSAAILWASTDRGKLIPIDKDPRARGTIALELDDAGALRANANPPASTGPRYMSHFATCPDADFFRR